MPDAWEIADEGYRRKSYTPSSSYCGKVSTLRHPRAECEERARRPLDPCRDFDGSQRFKAGRLPIVPSPLTLDHYFPQDRHCVLGAVDRHEKMIVEIAGHRVDAHSGGGKAGCDRRDKADSLQ